MSFHHVLPSNVALETFPNNTASSYSTPLTNPYDLKGRWEVALMNITYSGCVNTFNNDTITVSKIYSTPERLKQATKPIRISLPKKKSMMDLVQEMNTTLKGIAEIELIKPFKRCGWKVVDKNFCLVLSPRVQRRFNLWTDVITSYDFATYNHTAFPKGHHETLYWEEDLYLILVPMSYNATKFVLKQANENITAETLIERFNERVPNANLKLASSEVHFIASKQCPPVEHCNESVLLLSPNLLHALQFRRAGMYASNSVRYWSYDFSRQFKSEWFVTELKIDKIHDVAEYIDKEITVQPQVFGSHKKAVAHLNALDESFEFVLNADNTLKLKIKQENVKVSFSNTLRDSLAFDSDKYGGKGIYHATGKFSLSRRIKYLYIYSSLGKYVRIGDTEAPLLAIIPFDSDNCKLLKERTFAEPMYIALRSQRISQIDVLICDGAGEVIPFAAESLSSLRIHFRQV